MNYSESMRIFLFIIYIFLALTVQAKDVYRSVDANGNVIFSDTPSAGAEKIVVDEIQTVSPGEVPKFEYTPPAEATGSYSRLEIVSPENDSVIQSDDGDVSVSVILEPAINVRVGHYLVLYLDGSNAASGTGLQYKLSNIDRGTHTLTVAVVDQSGNQVIGSPAVSFTLYKYSVLHQQPAPAKPPTPPAPTPVP